MNVIAIIPARRGSKRVPEKNLAMLGERTLLEWAIKSAHDAGIWQVVVSTDGVVAAAMAAEHNCAVRRRPDYLSTDDAPMMPVVRDVVQTLTAGINFDAVLLLQPTSPLRTGGDITAALAVMRDTGAEAVISVTDAPSDEVFELGRAGRLRNVRAIDPLVTPNGAIYLIQADKVMNHLWWDCVCYAYRMPKERSLDINTSGDLELARTIVAKQEAT